jgi:dihydrofolate reductase
MTISAIVAVAENNAIGRDNQLPWHLPDDLKFFKKTTIGKPVLMGRKTYESMGGQLKGRLNIVISRQHLSLPEGVLLYHSITEGLERMQSENTDEAFIIGGGQIFEETMSVTDRLYITRVHTNIDDATAFFPHVDHTHWKLSWEERHEADEKHKYAFTFQRWERIKQI